MTGARRPWRLILGEDLGHHLVDAEVGADGLGDLPGVAGDHHDPAAHGLELADGVAGLGADLVFEGDAADADVEHLPMTIAAAIVPFVRVSRWRSPSCR